MIDCRRQIRPLEVEDNFEGVRMILGMDKFVIKPYGSLVLADNKSHSITLHQWQAGRTATLEERELKGSTKKS